MSKQKPLKKIARPSDDALLIDRNQARTILGNCSYSTILRMEAEGKLTPIRLTGSVKAKVFLRLSQVKAALGKPHPDEVNIPVPTTEPSKHAQKKPHTIIVDGRRYVEVVEPETA